MKKYENWEFFEDMINEKNIVSADEFLLEEKEVEDEEKSN